MELKKKIRPLTHLPGALFKALGVLFFVFDRCQKSVVVAERCLRLVEVVHWDLDRLDLITRGAYRSMQQSVIDDLEVRIDLVAIFSRRKEMIGEVVGARSVCSVYFGAFPIIIIFEVGIDQCRSRLAPTERNVEIAAEEKWDFAIV